MKKVTNLIVENVLKKSLSVNQLLITAFCMDTLINQVNGSASGQVNAKKFVKLVKKDITLTAITNVLNSQITANKSIQRENVSNALMDMNSIKIVFVSKLMIIVLNTVTLTHIKKFTLNGLRDVKKSVKFVIKVII